MPYALPGFLTPVAIKESDRLFAAPDGTVTWTVDAPASAALDMTLIVFNMGGQCVRRIIIDEEQVTRVEADKLKICIPTDKVQLSPGHYRMRAYDKAGTVLDDAIINVLPDPTNAAAHTLGYFSSDGVTELTVEPPTTE